MNAGSIAIKQVVRNSRRKIMSDRSSTGAVAAAFVSALMTTMTMTMMTIGGVRAADDGKYPTSWKGQWTRVVHREVEVQGAFDQTKPWGLGQQAPLTPEYQKVLADSMADQANGGLGNYPTSRCLPSGMPRMMTFATQEYVITPETTYILLSSSDHVRRIFTDGRDWPTNPQPSYGGYSIGRWIDEDGDGRYDVLEAETRHFKGPRAFDASGIPLHEDDESVVKERIYLDKADRNLLHDEITVIDHALTRPWKVMKSYRRNLDPLADWPEYICIERNPFIHIGNEYYKVSQDGYLMPTRENQPPPDSRYFTQRKK